MKILLVGEYSGVHTNLKKGLEKLGAEVLLVSEGDVWKKFEADIKLYYPEDKKWKKIYNQCMLERCCKWAEGVDIVQFINPSCLYFINKDYSDYIFRLIDKATVSVTVLAGCDCNMSKNYEKLIPCICPACQKEYLRWHSQCPFRGNKLYQKYEKCFYEMIDCIIPGEWDYYKIYHDYVNKYNNKMSKIIPYPIDCYVIRPSDRKHSKIVFHSPLNRTCKGTIIVQKAFKILQKKYKNEADFEIRGHMPIGDYLQYLDNIDVIVDGVKGYGYGLGMSCLMAMAKGKIAIGAREPEEDVSDNAWLSNSPQIDVCGGLEGIINAVEILMDSPDQIRRLQKESRGYVRRYHHAVNVAKQYMDLYKKLLQTRIV